jgi:hypothetical protein
VTKTEYNARLAKIQAELNANTTAANTHHNTELGKHRVAYRRAVTKLQAEYDAGVTGSL